MHVVCTSDTHGFVNELLKFRTNPPKADIFIHAGDITNQNDTAELKKINEWLGTVPCKYKIVIAGNRDGIIEKLGPEKTKNIFTNAIYLEDEQVEIEGIKIYGSPWSARFGEWSFMASRGKEIASKWKNIPTGMDIIITHGPPYGILDVALNTGYNAGCEDLLEAIKEKKPKYHIFGHIHEGYGSYKEGETTFINASVCNIQYIPKNKPINFNI
jgi:Icc-related predicted phosphoesterase